MPASTCPKCAGAMVEGFELDESHGWRRPAGWVEGKPQRSVWTGVSLRGRRQLPIRSFRCRRCGFLESYATE